MIREVCLSCAVLTTVTACGGGTSTSPFYVVANDLTTPTVGTTGTTQSTVTAVATTPSQPTVAVGACVDTGTINDGWGWNGVTGCQLPITQADSGTVVVEAPPVVTPAPEAENNLQWLNTTWKCVSNLVDITDKWEIRLHPDMRLENITRGSSDPLKWGIWEGLGGTGFITQWPDGRTFTYTNLDNNFIDDGGSKCNRDSFPYHPSDEVVTPEPELPWLNYGSSQGTLTSYQCPNYIIKFDTNGDRAIHAFENSYWAANGSLLEVTTINGLIHQYKPVPSGSTLTDIATNEVCRHIGFSGDPFIVDVAYPIVYVLSGLSITCSTQGFRDGYNYIAILDADGTYQMDLLNDGRIDSVGNWSQAGDMLTIGDRDYIVSVSSNGKVSLWHGLGFLAASGDHEAHHACGLWPSQ